MITIITGIKNSGKTKYIEDWYRKEPKGVGCFARKVYADGHWLGYDLELAPHGETIPFIRLIPYRHLLKDTDIWLHNRFAFSRKAFCTAFEWLDAAVLKGKGPIWIDEVGNMEMKSEGYDIVIRNGIAKGLDMRMVFRYQHLEELIKHYGLIDYRLIDCNHLTNDRKE